MLQPHISTYTLRLSNCIYYINCKVILLMEYEVRSVPTELTPSTKSNVKTNVYACSIRVINSRCDILLDRSVVTHGFSRCGHNKLQYTVFCLLTVYLVVSSLYRSDDSISHADVTCQVRLLCYVLLYIVRVLFEFAIDTSRHRGRCAEK